MHSRSFAAKRDAVAFDIDIKARKMRSELLPRGSKWSLARAWDEWWEKRGKDLSPKTQDTYQWLWRAYMKGEGEQALPGFDHHLLTLLAAEPKLIEAHMGVLRDADVSESSRRKVLMVLSAVLTACVDWNEMPANPVRGLRAPRARPKRTPRPFPPLVVERIRRAMLDDQKRGTPEDHQRDASLVGLLCYSGLRPHEALALTFADVGERALNVDKAARMYRDKSSGRLSLRVGPTKTGSKRSVTVPPPLADDLAAWRKAQGNPLDSAPVFPGRGGGLWAPSGLDNWRYRVWKPVLSALAKADPSLAHLASARIYDARASFVSAMLRAGASPLEVADEAGHSKQVMYEHYAYQIKELRGEAPTPIAEQILRARRIVEATKADELRELVAESLKPSQEVSSHAYGLLYGPRRRGPGPQPATLEERDRPKMDE